MTTHHFCVVWIDHHEARLFQFGKGDVEALVIRPDHPTKHIHHKANSIGSGHAAPNGDYLHSVAEALGHAGAVLITGPGSAKTELVKHIHHHDPRLMEVIAGVETVDHPSDKALVGHAKAYFGVSEPRTQLGRRNFPAV